MGRAWQSSFSSWSKSIQLHKSQIRHSGLASHDFLSMYLRNAPAALGSHGSGTGVELGLWFGEPPSPPMTKGLVEFAVTHDRFCSFDTLSTSTTDPLALAPKPVKVYARGFGVAREVRLDDEGEGIIKSLQPPGDYLRIQSTQQTSNMKFSIAILSASISPTWGNLFQPEQKIKKSKGSKTASPSLMPSLTPSSSGQPSSGPSLTPSLSALPSSMPSLTPSSSGQPSSMPSVTPSESAQPSSMPSLVPSESSQPSSMPSVTPSESAQPSSMPSLVPSESSQPSSMPSLVPSESAQPSSMPSGAPSASGKPSGAPSGAPSASGEPSGAPSSTRDKLMKSLLLTVSSKDVLNNKGSPQEKALLWVTTSPLQPGTNDAQIIQQYILAVFYYATGGAGWTDNNGWLESSNECTWDHVVCSGGGDVVTKLILPFGNNLVGSIPSEVGSLDSLEYLVLYNNQLTGGIPTELGELGSLQYLDLSTNQLTGGIPTELGELDSLEGLYLYNNQLSEIPAELGGLGSLQTLALSTNQLSGVIPTELGGLGSLQGLYLNNNQLTGGIPTELGGLGSLQYLDLSTNQLSGVIPTELGGLGSLRGIDAGICNLGLSKLWANCTSWLFEFSKKDWVGEKEKRRVARKRKGC
eukprot:scaffold9839_cov157-Skeletonema_marinoi.AAC.2